MSVVTTIIKAAMATLSSIVSHLSSLVSLRILQLSSTIEKVVIPEGVIGNPDFKSMDPR
jgi:hypothetical protein